MTYIIILLRVTLCYAVQNISFYTLMERRHGKHLLLLNGRYIFLRRDNTCYYVLSRSRLLRLICFGSLGGSDCVETSRLSFHPVRFWAVVG